MVDKKLVAVGVGAGAVVAGVLIGRKLLSKSGEPPPAAPTTIDLTFAATAADAVAAQKGLNRNAPGDAGKTDRLRYFFLHRRAVELGLADESLRVPPGITQLQQRISAQLGQVEQFLAPRVGTASARGPYFGAARDTAVPIHHLDLGFYVRNRSIDPAASTEAAAIAATAPNPQEAQTLRELDARKMRVTAIVWRAAAIDADVWSGTGNAAVLRETELLKLLDRRLRAVERLHYEVSGGATDDRLFQDVPINAASSTQGPWVDEFLVHAFEHPSIARSARSHNGSWTVEEFILEVGKLAQRLEVFDATGGTFRLEFDGDFSVPIPFDASKDQVRSSIRTIPALGNAQIICSDGPLSTDLVRIEITDRLQPGSKLTADITGLTGPGPDPASVSLSFASVVFDVETQPRPRFNLDGPVVIGQRFDPHWYLNRVSDEFDWNQWPGTRLNDQIRAAWKPVPEHRFLKGYGWRLKPRAYSQTLSISRTPTDGEFQLVFDGQSTEKMGFAASAATVQQKLAQLPNLGQKVIATGGPLPDTVTLYFHESVSTGAHLVAGTHDLRSTSDPQPELSIGVRQDVDGQKPGEIINELLSVNVPSRNGPPDVNGNPTVIPGYNRRDWWDRSWLHADGVMSALHIEALRFALMRHNPTGPGLRPDDEFDALPWKYSLALDDCFELRQVAHPADSIMAPGRNEYFENGATALDDLQVGDQVIFADSPVLTALGRTAWDYPTLLVTDVDTSPDKAGINLTGLKVQGFGTQELSLPDFQLLQAGITDKVLERVRAYIPAEIARQKAEAAAAGTAFTPPDKLQWDIGILNEPQRVSGEDTVLRRWSPYGDTFDEPGPWWLWVNTHSELWRKVFGIQETPTVDGDTDGNGVIDDGEVEPPPPELDAAQVLVRMPGALIWTTSNDEEEDEDTGTNPHANTRIRFANFQSPWRPTGASPLLRVRADFQPPPFKDARDPSADHEDVIMIPLFQPYGDWDSYFETKVKSPNDSAWPSELRPVTADARWFTGLAADPTVLPADPTRVRVIRPRAKPAT